MLDSLTWKWKICILKFMFKYVIVTQMREEIHLYGLQHRIWTKGRNCKKMVINNYKIAKPCAKVSEKLYKME